jgi:hypothetical protein
LACASIDARVVARAEHGLSGVFLSKIGNWPDIPEQQD